jgi:hypothetical protein
MTVNQEGQAIYIFASLIPLTQLALAQHPFDGWISRKIAQSSSKRKCRSLFPSKQSFMRRWAPNILWRKSGYLVTGCLGVMHDGRPDTLNYPQSLRQG